MGFLVAHRGSGHRDGTHRENTLAAFVLAGALGATWVELDVRRTADGALAVHHDAAVAGLRPICELTVHELPAWVPLLDEALDACAGMGVICELKDLPRDPGHDPAWPLAAAVAAVCAERLAAAPDRPLVVSSFAPDALRTVANAEPSVPTAWLTMAAFDQHAALAMAADLGCAALQPYEAAVTPELVAAAHDLGLRLDTWTVNDPDRLEELARMGVDGLMTDDVPMALAALARAVLPPEG